MTSTFLTRLSAIILVLAIAVAGIGVAAAGVVGIASGVWMSLRVSSLQKRVESGDTDPQLRTQGHQAQTLQWVGYGVGAAALIGGGVLYYLGAAEATGAHQPKQLSLSAVPTPAGAFAVLRGRF